MSQHSFRKAVGGFFYANADLASSLLPKDLLLLEPHPGQAIVNVTAFDFYDSVVGPYAELVISLSVAPWATEEKQLPHGAMFPIFLGTSTNVSRVHSTEAWKLPDYGRCIEIMFDHCESQHTIRAEVEGQTLLQLTVTMDTKKCSPSKRLYQCFSIENNILYHAPIVFAGDLCEHEQEKGQLLLGEHPDFALYKKLIEEPIPLREQYMLEGEESFGDLLLYQPRRRNK